MRPYMCSGASVLAPPRRAVFPKEFGARATARACTSPRLLQGIPATARARGPSSDPNMREREARLVASDGILEKPMALLRIRRSASANLVDKSRRPRFAGALDFEIFSKPAVS
eukprot:7867512-Pyramimonas_sp.AAC.1